MAAGRRGRRPRCGCGGGRDRAVGRRAGTRPLQRRSDGRSEDARNGRVRFRLSGRVARVRRVRFGQRLLVDRRAWNAAGGTALRQRAPCRSQLRLRTTDRARPDPSVRRDRRLSRSDDRGPGAHRKREYLAGLGGRHAGHRRRVRPTTRLLLRRGSAHPLGDRPPRDQRHERRSPRGDAQGARRRRGPTATRCTRRELPVHERPGPDGIGDPRAHSDRGRRYDSASCR